MGRFLACFAVGLVVGIVLWIATLPLLLMVLLALLALLAVMAGAQ